MPRLIGITPCLDPGLRLRPGRDYLYVARAYSQAVARAGGTPVLLTPDTKVTIVAELAAVVISGGDDLPTRFDREDARAALGEPEVAERIRWERGLLDAALGRVPILGICYGMQLINLHLGGSLHRDLRDGHPGALDHGGSGRVTKHAVSKLVDSPWLSLLPEAFETNSSHGQAVDTLAPGLRAVAQCEDGVLEAFDGPGIFGVEWHPETCQTAAALYGQFVKTVLA